MSKLKWYRLLLKNKSKGISFIEDVHKYYYGLEEFSSVSSIISKYYLPFDENGEIKKRCALAKGITVEELATQWEETRDLAANTGTRVHEIAEKKILGINSLETYSKELEPYVVAIDKFKRSLSDRTYVLGTEVMVYSEKYKVAGQIDLLLIDENYCVHLLDWKTNKDIRRDNDWGNMMINGLNHLPDCEYSKYSLQLSLYAKMLSDWGINVSGLELIHLRKYDYSRIAIKYLDKEAEYILDKELNNKG